MEVILYGIPNCDQVKKARNWFSDHNIEVQFHDFKKLGIHPETIEGWLKYLDAEFLLNRKGSTWRNLTLEERSQVVDDTSAISCMVKYPSLIKRPVLVARAKDVTQVSAGFSEENYRQTFL